VRVREVEPERGAAVTVRFEPEDAIEAADTAECVRRKVLDAVHRFGRRSVGTDSNCDARRGAGVAGSMCSGSAFPGAHPCRSYVDALARHRGVRPPMVARSWACPGARVARPLPVGRQRADEKHGPWPSYGSDRQYVKCQMIGAGTYTERVARVDGTVQRRRGVHGRAEMRSQVNQVHGCGPAREVTVAAHAYQKGACVRRRRRRRGRRRRRRRA
jgi:hypothetical protein